MTHMTYFNDSLLRYNTVKSMEGNHQNLKEIKAKLHQKLNTGSVEETLKKTRNAYLELQALETIFSHYPSKEKQEKKSNEVKQIIWEIQEKKDELRALCGTTHPFTETGRTKLNSVTKNPKETVSFGNIVIEPESINLIPKEDIWVKLQDEGYKKEMATYSEYVTKNRFTKITDESLQGTLLATCINNENAKLIPLEREFALMARIYQKLYNNCLKINKDLVSIPEVRSKIQSDIINLLNERLIDYSTSKDRLKSLEILDRSIQQYNLNYDSDIYKNWPLGFVKDVRFEHEELKNTTIDALKEYNKQLKTEINKLKKQLTPVAYSKFKENFSRFGDLIQQVNKYPYQDLKIFSTDILEKGKDSLKSKTEQINTYRDETVNLYRKKKELEEKIHSLDQGSEVYNLLKNEKTQVEKRLEAFCATTSPFTETGKKMIYLRSKEEVRSIISRANNKQPLGARIGKAKRVSESEVVTTKRREPEHSISHA